MYVTLILFKYVYLYHNSSELLLDFVSKMCSLGIMHVNANAISCHLFCVFLWYDSCNLKGTCVLVIGQATFLSPEPVHVSS